MSELVIVCELSAKATERVSERASEQDSQSKIWVYEQMSKQRRE